MNTIRILLILFTLIFSVTACNNNDDVFIPENLDIDQKSAQIIAADNQFGLELFRLIDDEEDADKNLMISPLSVSIALAMAYNGAEGNTQEQMEEMLHKVGLTPDEINQSYKYLVEALESRDSKVELAIANSIFYHQDYTIKDEFISTNKSYYDAEVEALNFRDEAATLARVNGWVKENTRDKIEKIIEFVSPAHVMYLINAIYFNGEWTYQFDKDNTTDQVFFLDDQNDIDVPTMMIEETFPYINTEKFELLEMPYGSEKYSMLIFLPHESYSTGDVIEEISPEKLDDWINNMADWEKKVFLPKMEFAYENSLVDNLKALGMTDAFNAQISNFRGITDDTDLFISDVKHKSYIKVDERGTEAAAVTGIVFETTSIQPGKIFAVDHPFVFAIREKDTNAILFIGKVVDPSKDGK